MISLPQCRWIGEPVAEGRVLCRSRKKIPSATGVPVERCVPKKDGVGCYCFDHEPTAASAALPYRTEAAQALQRFAPPLPKRPPCRYLGDATGESVVCNVGCPSSNQTTLRPLFACAVHKTTTREHFVKGQMSCNPAICKDYEASQPVPSPTAGRIRHLLYHVYPRKLDGGTIWRWNVAELRKRLSLFNGRRVIGIATDASTEPASAVREALAGCGCEFIEAANVPNIREGSTFLALHERVAEFTGPEHVTLFGHAKGITSERWAAGVRQWTESLYATCLDHWPAVRPMLETHPMVGPWKRLGKCFPESNSDWHFSGSWRWFRNADFFARDWRQLEQYWCCAESHPSMLFRAHEAACIVGEFSHTGLALYRGEEWDGWAGKALREWKERHAADRQAPLLLTSILCSHQKPATVHETVKSILAQTSADWRLVVIDSGALMEELRPYEADPRVKVLLSPDGPKPQGWQYNEVLRQGLAVGDLIHYMTDDDVLDPGVFAAWLDAARLNPDQSAWYGWADRTEVRRDGSEVKLGELRPDVLGGLGGARLNCKVDGIQVCHRRGVVAPWPEERAVGWNADGRFLDALGELVSIHPLAVKVGRHRHCRDSTFTKSSDAS